MRTALALLLTLAPAAAQTTWYVDVNGVAPGTGTPSDPYTSIQYAASQPTTLNSDTLLVAPGTYFEHVYITNKRLTVRGAAGPETTILRGVVPGPIVKLDEFSSLQGFTITGWIPGAPGFINSAVWALDCELRNCIVRDNAGTAIYAQYHLNLRNCSLLNNGLPVHVDSFSGGALFSESILSGGFLTAGGFENVFSRYSIADFDGFAPSSFGPGNLELDPQFWDPTGGDANLRPTSPAIDAGDPASPLDPDGSRRDIGALAYDANYLPAPLLYCTSQTNSLGCAPSIGSSGIASATSASPCFVTCSNQINQRAGFLFYGYAPRAHPYQGGFLCVQSPTRRTTPQNSGGSSSGLDCSGTFSYELNALIQSGVDPALAPGTFVYGQYWSRDPAAASTANRSDAVRLAIAP
jgi:hypothetical protein